MRTKDCVVKLMLLVLWMVLPVRGDDPTVDFQRQIQPIFAEHCARCHGVNSESREAGLRLDVREAALEGGDSGPAFTPGDPDTSELIARITTDDLDYVMPPPSENSRLNEKQKSTLASWIRQGAPYAEHWSFVAPKKIAIADDEHQSPIDTIVTEKRRSDGMSLAEPAADAIVCRRIYLDLIGLPPSSEQLDGFSRAGLEATVDQLFASERFGEKWARHWLDVARYSDTNGYEKDRRREQWAWRDWVINALNEDLPYDQFIVEQVAGDLLPNATQAQIVATGFLRNSMLNEEGAIVPEQFRMVEMFDRMDCIGKAVLGLTTQCAQCHTHKFDPLTHDEYFGMFAFLNNAYEAQSYVFTERQQQQRTEITQSITQLENKIRAKHSSWQAEVIAWQKEQLSKQVAWRSFDAVELGSNSGLNHPVQLADKSLLMLGHSSEDMFVIAEPTWHRLTGLRIELLPHGDLPHRGPGRGDSGDWEIKEIEVFVQTPKSEKWEQVKLTKASADFSQPVWTSDDGKQKKGPVAHLVDGSLTTTWRADRGAGRLNQASAAVMQFENPLKYVDGTKLKIAMRMNAMVGSCRFSLTEDAEPTALPVNHAAVLAMEKPEDVRSPTEQQAIFTAWRNTLDDCQAENQQINNQWDRLPNALTTVLHLTERDSSNHRQTFALDRGEWDRPKHNITPHTPAALHAMPADAPLSRLGFASWLASKESPLTARVAVNRIWQAMFGEGLVETPEDFGTRARVPEYRELLDWLAVDFMEHGWSQKHLIKQIVSSKVYRQRSAATAEELARDPKNRLLTRGPRFRADAEVIRDIALTASGLIHHQVGGAPVIPPVPQNVLDYNYVYPSYWKPAEGPDRYRRSLYGFRKRSMPDPVMSSFDSPNGDSACARRVRSNTPLAALTGLNETIFVESARALALRVLREGGDSDADRTRFAFRQCTSRWPSSAETDEVVQLIRDQRKRLADGWLNPREITTGEGAELPELPAGTTPQDAAAWTLACRVLLNLDETISKK